MIDLLCIVTLPLELAFAFVAAVVTHGDVVVISTCLVIEGSDFLGGLTVLPGHGLCGLLSLSCLGLRDGRNRLFGLLVRLGDWVGSGLGCWLRDGDGPGLRIIVRLRDRDGERPGLGVGIGLRLRNGDGPRLRSRVRLRLRNGPLPLVNSRRNRWLIFIIALS